MYPSLLGVLVAAAHMLIGVGAHSNGVGSCAAGFDKFPQGTEHNWQNSDRPGGLLGDNWGDVAFSGMSLTLGDTELTKPVGSDQFHYTGECNADYLCGKCQGGCVDDAGCEEGLQCLLLGADEAVPGCSGTIGAWDGTSYCYDPEEATGRRRQLQGQEAFVTATFQTNTPYALKLEAPGTTLIKGYMFRLEGEDGQDMFGAFESVSANMQVLDSAEEMEDIEGGLTLTTMCAPTVAAVSHTESGDKDLVEALITVPEAGTVNFEAVVMVGEHQWYLTNYVLQFEEGESTSTESPTPMPVSESSPAPTMSESPPPMTNSEPSPSPTMAASPAMADSPPTSGTRKNVLSLYPVVLVVLGLALC